MRAPPRRPATAARRRSAPDRRRRARSRARPAAIAARASSSLAIRRVESAIADDGRGSQRRGQPQQQLRELGEWRDDGAGRAAAVLEIDAIGAGLVHEHERVRRAAVQQAERDARVERVQDRALPLHEQEVSALGPLEHESLGRAGDVVGDHVIDGDAPARDRDADLPGGHEDRALPGRSARRP